MRHITYRINSPTILYPYKTGVTYYHQYNGVGCYQFEMEGYIEPMRLYKSDDFDMAHFNSQVWYNRLRCNEYDPNFKLSVNIVDTTHKQWFDKCNHSFWGQVFNSIEGLTDLKVNREISQYEALVECTDEELGQCWFMWENCD